METVSSSFSVTFVNCSHSLASGKSASVLQGVMYYLKNVLIVLSITSTEQEALYSPSNINLFV